jgi:SAM-dependent methyltransferase
VPGPRLTRAATSLRLRTLDAFDALSGRRDRLTPPRRMDFVGHSAFAATGDEFLGHFVALAGLGRDERVLDVGCGIGRMARPLTRHLSAAGSYDGFDVNAAGIAWCRERYRAFPNFRFAHADLRNGRYNAGGGGDAAGYRFPYDDGRFDLVILTSVLTHLLAAETRRYLAETRRVLAPGGRMLATFFVVDDAARAALRAGRAAPAFGPPHDGMSVADPAVPEEAVAHDEDWVHAALDQAGLRGAQIHPGTWPARPARAGRQALSFQDIVVARA